MKVREFYEKMKDILDDPVTIMDGVVLVYNDFMKDTKIYEYLLDYTIKSIYIGKDNTLVVEI